MGVVEGASPFAAIDFQRASQVFAPLQVHRRDASTQPAVLRLRNLHLFNLPYTSKKNIGGSIRRNSLCALLWISKPSTKRLKEPVYVLDNVTASVSCAEVAFLKRFFERLQLNAAKSESSDTVIEFTARFLFPLIPSHQCYRLLIVMQSDNTTLHVDVYTGLLDMLP